MAFTSLTGVVRDNTIQFDSEIGLPDGQAVNVTFQPVAVAGADVNDRLAADFHRLSDEWKRATGHLSNVSQKVRHPSYQAIIAMGDRAVPLILADLQAAANDWFIALEKITGEDPIPETSYGVVDAMAKAWIDWANGRGYDW